MSDDDNPLSPGAQRFFHRLLVLTGQAPARPPLKPGDLDRMFQIGKGAEQEIIRPLSEVRRLGK